MKSIVTVTLNPAFDLHYSLEQFFPGRENYVNAAVTHAGGKGINTSRALAASGIPSTAYVVLGRQNSASFEAELQAAGVLYSPLYTEGRIRENITLHPASGEETRISLDLFSAPPEILSKMEERLTQEVSADAFLSFSGRIPRGLDRAEVAAFLCRLRERGIRLAVDSNSFSASELAQIHPRLIKPNREEIAALSGDDAASPENAAPKLVRSGVAEEVLITLGGDGAVWSDGETTLRLSVPFIGSPVSTIGAGDSTIAGYLAGCAEGLSPAETLAQALAFGTAACLCPGTLPPRPSDIAEIKGKICVTRI